MLPLRILFYFHFTNISYNICLLEIATNNIERVKSEFSSHLREIDHVSKIGAL